MLPLQTEASVHGVHGVSVLKVMTPAELESTSLDLGKCLLWETDAELSRSPPRALAGTISDSVSASVEVQGSIRIIAPRDQGVIAPGDVIRVTEGSSEVRVLYRRGSRSNTLLATERCNSYCLMCSQPPRRRDDSWLAGEMLQTIPLIDKSEPQLGISGGEPTLLGDDLVVVVHAAKTHLPSTHLHILSNGRRFADPSLAAIFGAVKHPSLQWGIPLYSDRPEIHDYIVQSAGAWEETLTGLHNLARHRASIELRVVVQQSNVERLGELAYFVFRNLTFVDHVAFMGLEPMGFAKGNYDRLWIDQAECAEQLKGAVYFLANRGMTVSMFNFPLCTTPRDLWPFCRQSISDWKNVYVPACATCDWKSECSGFFASVTDKWISKSVRPMSRAIGQGALT